jgi:5-methylcytosine-specific restriction endonuclease McrA
MLVEVRVMMLKDMPHMLRSMVIRTVRQWFPRTEKYRRVKSKARVESPKYKKDGTLSKVKDVSYRCNICARLSKDIEVDHKRTVVALFDSTSTMTLSQYIKKIDCPESNLQVLCKSCHKEKSKEENKKRVKNKRNTNKNTGNPLKVKKNPIKSIKKARKIKI